MRMQERKLTPAARAALDAAGRLFYERGITAVGVEAVAAEAGVTKKTVYDQFKSKSALVCAYLAERDENYRTLVDTWIREHPDTSPLVAVFDALAEWLRTRGPKGCAFVHAHAELLSEPDHPAHEVIRGEKDWLLTTFTTLARDAGLAEPEAIGTRMSVLHEGAMVLASTTDLPDVVAEARRAAEAVVAAAATA